MVRWIALAMTSSNGALNSSDVTLDRLRCRLKPLCVPLGKVLYESGAQPDEVCFPATAIVSLQYELANGTRAGNEGLVRSPS
jgi:hypothetical protein